MGAKTLVDPDTEGGRRILTRLDSAKFQADAAFWMLLSDSEWRFFIHSPLVDERGRSYAYHKLQEALKGIKDLVPLKRITLLKGDDPLLGLFRLAVSTNGEGISEIRFSRNTINGTFIEDALLYRV